MEKSYDVIVAGAGPAGSTCALFLARAGHRVLVLEKETFPRDKICADNKTWKCLDIVRELGLWSEFQKLPKAPIRGVLVASPDGHQMLTRLHPEDEREKGTWYNVKRLHFDNMLARACKREKNIAFREQCEVLRPLFDEHDSTQIMGVEFRNEKGKLERIHGRVVVGSDGSASVIASAVGVPSEVKGRFATNTRAYFEGVKGTRDVCELYYLKGICPGYFWIFPVDEKTCNVGIGMRPEDYARQHKSMEQILQETLASDAFKGRFAKAAQVSEWKTWGISVLGKRRTCAGNGWVLVGDAGTFAMTFSGEGCGPGMRTGKMAAQSIDRALRENDVSQKSLRRYEENLWNILGPEVAGFRWLEFLLLHEKVFDWVVARAANNPELMEISSRMQNNYALSQKMVAPATVLKLLFTSPERKAGVGFNTPAR